VRPDRLRLAAIGAPSAVGAEIYSSEPFGKHAIVTVDFGGLLVKVKTTMAAAAAAGDGINSGIGRPVGVLLPADEVTLFDGITGAAIWPPSNQT
jgi:multiple sugar transport system ATP-binding protein